MKYPYPEELKNSLSNIVNLSSEDPENIYVAKWNIENKLKEKDSSYTKRNLSRFITDLNLGNSIFVYDGSSIPFTIYEGYLFVASDLEIGITKLKESLEILKYDLNNLHIYDNMNLMKGISYGSTYFIIDSKVMVNDKLN